MTTPNNVSSLAIRIKSIFTLEIRPSYADVYKIRLDSSAIETQSMKCAAEY
jgi:hypothetical protein